MSCVEAVKGILPAGQKFVIHELYLTEEDLNKHQAKIDFFNYCIKATVWNFFHQPKKVLDHLGKFWRHDTPFEPNIAVIDEIGIGSVAYTVHDGSGGWFVGNLEDKPA
jgi:hypothetical protein